MDCCLDALGYNPGHSAIRQNPKLSTFQNTLSTLQACNTSSIITKNLNIKLAAHRKIRKNITHLERPYCDAIFKPNQQINGQL